MSQPKTPLVLTREEKQSQLWKKLTEHWQDRLTHFQQQNEFDQVESNTIKLRGRIAEIRSNLALGQDKPVID